QVPASFSSSFLYAASLSSPPRAVYPTADAVTIAVTTRNLAIRMIASRVENSHPVADRVRRAALGGPCYRTEGSGGVDSPPGRRSTERRNRTDADRFCPAALRFRAAGWRARRPGPHAPGVPAPAELAAARDVPK